MDAIPIEKADGSIEAFNPDKLRGSLLRSGANDQEADKVVGHVTKELKAGDSTAHIYRHAFSYLKHMRAGIAARYSLRRSLAALGPSGFPFEHFVAEIFRAEGYTPKTNLHLQGKCAKHEVDVIASNGEEFLLCEVKFHNQSNVKSDLKVALYVKARYDDLKETNFDGENGEKKPSRGLLITNTKFTTHAISYGVCSGLNLLGWSYPREKNIQDLIEKHKLEPLTTLTTLNVDEKREMLRNGIVLCRNVHNDKTLLQSLGVQPDRVEKILEEAHNVCY